MVAGYYNANGALYRFAAVELVAPSGARRRSPGCWPVAAWARRSGLWLARESKQLFITPFLGAYVLLDRRGGARLVLISRIDFPALPQPVAGQTGRSSGELMRQPVFLVAIVLASALGLWRHELADGRHAHRHGASAACLSATRPGAAVACAGDVCAQLLHGCGDQTRGRDARAVGGRAAQPGLRGRGAQRPGPRTVHGGPAAAGRGLELPLRGRHHALHAGLPARRRRAPRA